MSTSSDQKRRAQPLIAVVSARPDGATTLAVGLAALHSATGRTLLIDFNVDRADIAPLLDVGERRTMYHLAYNAQLSPVTAADLDEHLVWHEGIAVLAGVARAAHRSAITDYFVDSLLAAAVSQFDHVVVDLGRVRAALPVAASAELLLWAVAPGPLGTAAVDKACVDLAEATTPWVSRVGVVLNRCGRDSFDGVDRFLEREYSLEVVADVPEAGAYWKGVELSHSLRALMVPAEDERSYLKRYGPEALATRRALEKLTDSAAGAAGTVEMASGG